MKFNYKSLFIPLLQPISWIWECLYRVRRFLFQLGYLESNEFKVPIISVGNLTLGGTGKTPFTLWLSNYLNRSNKKVMVLTRGYKGALESSNGIIKSGRKIGENPFEFGDEALVLSRGIENGSVVVGKRRSENLTYYFEEEEPDVVILDDGHQHLKIQRSLNIVLFDSLLPLERYHTPPMGYLREGMTALKDADVIIFGRVDLVSDKKIEDLEKLVTKYKAKKCPIVKFKYEPRFIKDINYNEAFTFDELKSKKVVCLSAIASPDSFHRLIENLGCEIIKNYEFPDHHFYTEGDVKDVFKLAEENDAIILTTEKDIVKLRRLTKKTSLFYVDIGIHFVQGEEDMLNEVNKVIY